MSKVNNAEELATHVKFKEDEQILVEEFIKWVEFKRSRLIKTREI
jgi:hypothetical protein